MTQKGNHTWDIILDYHLCPNCKRIVENRQDYMLSSGQYVKEIKCPYCDHQFSCFKEKKARWSLFSGSDDAPEWDWPER